MKTCPHTATNGLLMEPTIYMGSGHLTVGYRALSFISDPNTAYVSRRLRGTSGKNGGWYTAL